MAYAHSAGIAPTSPLRAASAFIRKSLNAAECFAADGDKVKEIHYLNSLSDDRLTRMGIARSDISNHVCGK